MSGQQSHLSIRDELRTEHARLDAGCRTHWGVSADMFRTAKYIFYMVVLAFSAYLIQYAAVDPFLSMAFAALLITGPEGLEQWLIRTGQIQQSNGDNE